MIFIMLFVILAPFFSYELFSLDPNSGVRSVLWRDVVLLLQETNYIGVGFGTEYISNRFDYIGAYDWRLGDPDADGFIFLGTHSSFYDLSLRVGCIGLFLFIYWMYPVISPKKFVYASQYGGVFVSVAIMFIITNAVNVGLFSINFLIGTSVMIGFMSAMIKLAHQEECKNV
jgi:O-antigen ligase